MAINGEKWDGKIRLVGFVDVFFLLCYSGESRFEKGIIVYSTLFPFLFCLLFLHPPSNFSFFLSVKKRVDDFGKEIPS